MRVCRLLLALALLASACSSTADQPQLSADVEQIPEVSENSAGADADASSAESEDDTSAGRMLAEPSDGLADGTVDEDFPEGLAFESNDTEPADQAASDTDSETSTDPAQPATTVPNEPPTEFDMLLNELIAFVEDERGYEFTSRPSVELLDSAEFGVAWSALIAEDYASNTSDYNNYTDIYRAMGIIEGDRSLEEIWQRFGDAGVIGYYDHDSASIKLRSGDINAFTETVLVHELVHALEDQIFDIDRPEYGDAQNELEWTFSALIEGSARRIETNYRATFSSAKLEEEADARAALPRAVSLTEFNSSFLELQFGRYRYGETFATTLWDNGKGTLDEAFAKPPATSEAILDPNGFLSASPTPTIKKPPAEGEVFEAGVWGQAGWASILSDLTDRTEALAIADGWNGDAFVAWRQDGQTCVRSHIAGDTPDELDDYAAALEEWARLGDSREVFYPTADLIRVTACA